MDRAEPARPKDAVELFGEVRVLVEELGVRITVAHVARAVGVGVDRRERRRVELHIHGVVRELPGDFHAVAVVEGRVLTVPFVETEH